MRTDLAANASDPHVFHSAKNGSQLTFWIVLPFYKGFPYDIVRRAVVEAITPWQRTLALFLGEQPNFRFSFKNAHANLERALLKCSVYVLMRAQSHPLFRPTSIFHQLGSSPEALTAPIGLHSFGVFQ